MGTVEKEKRLEALSRLEARCAGTAAAADKEVVSLGRTAASTAITDCTGTALLLARCPKAVVENDLLARLLCFIVSDDFGSNEDRNSVLPFNSDDGAGEDTELFDCPCFR